MILKSMTGALPGVVLLTLLTVPTVGAAADSCVQSYRALSEEYNGTARMVPGSPQHIDAVINIENRIFSALEACPDHPRLLALLSECELGIGRYVFAEHYARRIVEKTPDYWRGHVVLGWLLVAADRFDEGLAELERGAALVPDNVAVRLNLCQAYARAGRKEAALNACAAVVRSEEPDLAARAQKILDRISQP